MDHEESDNLDPELSDEELRRIERSSVWFSTEQVLARLEELRQASDEPDSK